MELLLQESIKITLDAGSAIMGFYHKDYSVKDKSPDNPVTEADLAADAILRRGLTALLPGSKWLSEESVDDHSRVDAAEVWIVDPLDGTKEFVKGIPEFAISVALVRDRKPVLGIVYNPATKELFVGTTGGGIQLNGISRVVSTTKEFVGAVVDASRSERLRGEFQPFEGAVTLKTTGSIAYKLARVASGLVDATWSRGPKNEWDICAGTLLVREAGGFCVDLDFRPISFNKPKPKVNGIVAANNHLYQQIQLALAPHRDSARTD